MSYDYTNMITSVLFRREQGPRGALSTKAIEQHWLRLLGYPDDWDGLAFRDALKRGYEEGKFRRRKRSYYLSAAAINSEVASRAVETEAEIEEAEVELDPDELLAAYATWLTERGYCALECHAMIETYAVALGLMYGFGDPADDDEDDNNEDGDD